MTVTATSLKRTLESVFGVSFICEEVDAMNCGYKVAPCDLANPNGFSVEVLKPYPDSCRASIQFGPFSKALLEKWLRSPENMEKAFSFAKGVSPKSSLDVRLAGQKAKSAEELLEIANTHHELSSLSAKLFFREVAEEDQDYYFYLSVIAALGFALYASGLVVEPEQLEEGEEHFVLSKRYERNPINRAKCISYHGSSCAACGFDFGATYGSFASGYIEVHHRTPLSLLNGPVPIDPIKDLVPLCSNCHSAVHLTNPPKSPEELEYHLISLKETE